MSRLELIRDRLVRALEALPESGDPHVLAVRIEDRPQGPVAVVQTVAGARFEVWEPAATEVPVTLATLAAALRPELPALEGEPYDLYSVSGAGLAGLEVRSLAGVSLLEIGVRTDGVWVRARVRQDDEARWTAEDDGRIGEAFQDFAERNALWTGLGGPRPRGWRLDVVEPGEEPPDILR